MPEGDTLFRIATRLRPVLVGQMLVEARGGRLAPDAPSLAGHCVTSVEARGKHLLIDLADGRAIHSHLGMTGSWHVYAPREPWAKPVSRAGLVLVTPPHVVVNFSPKLIEITTQRSLRRDPYLNRLGPDLMDEGFDPVGPLPRVRTFDAYPIGEVVMNQTVVRGIGNVYKSETLFLCRLDPWAPVRSLDDARLIDLLRVAHKLMRRNRGGGRRTTRHAGDGQRMWVYGRRGEPCFQCGEVIQVRRQGELGRTTYWCTTCQPIGESHSNDL